MAEFCACVGSHSSGPNLDDDEILMCDMYEPDDELNVEVEVDVELVCGIDDAEDDEFVTADYRGLWDVDGWQRRDLWEGNPASIPKRVSMTSAPTHIISTISSTSSLHILRLFRPHQGFSIF